MSNEPTGTATLTDSELAALAGLDAPAAQPTPWREFWRHFSANAGAVAGLVIVLAVLLIAVFAGVLAPHSPIAIDNAAYLKPPAWISGGSWTYPLGTDAIGRDILSRLMHGARLSLSIGVAVVALSVIVGTCLGMAAAFFRGVTEIAIMRLMDVLLSLPSLLLAIVIVAILGPGLMNAMLAVAVVVLPHYVRTARAAALGFLGLGAQPPAPEWGTMLADAREFVLRAWWVVTFPGLVILITVLAFNLLGDGLRDALDPKLKR